MDGGTPTQEPRDAFYQHWIFTLPNIICMVRLVGSLGLLAVAEMGWRIAFVGLFVALSLSDWIDGRLARWLRQRSDLGARLDSFADAALYSALLLGAARLAWPLVLAQMGWIAVAIGSYFITTGAGIIKYHRVPSYHTWAAKKTQFLVLVAGISLVLEWAVWPLQLAATAATLTNLETTVMTLVLPHWRADVSSLWKVYQERRRQP